MFANRQGWVIGFPGDANETTADDDDAYDDVLLAAGRLDELLARHYGSLRDRTRLRVREPDRDDVLQAAVLRLVGELRRGRTYTVPFRVVAHQVLGWAIDAHHEAMAEAARRDGGVPEKRADMADPVDDYEGVVVTLTVEAIIATLPEGDRVPTRMRVVEGCDISEIARRLGRTRNAIDQALARGRRHLRGGLDDGR